MSEDQPTCGDTLRDAAQAALDRLTWVIQYLEAYDISGQGLPFRRQVEKLPWYDAQDWLPVARRQAAALRVKLAEVSETREFAEQDNRKSGALFDAGLIMADLFKISVPALRAVLAHPQPDYRYGKYVELICELAEKLRAEAGLPPQE